MNSNKGESAEFKSFQLQRQEDFTVYILHNRDLPQLFRYELLTISTTKYLPRSNRTLRFFSWKESNLTTKGLQEARSRPKPSSPQLSTTNEKCFLHKDRIKASPSSPDFLAFLQPSPLAVQSGPSELANKNSAKKKTPHGKLARPAELLTSASCSEAVTGEASVREDILVLHICLQRSGEQPQNAYRSDTTRASPRRRGPGVGAHSPRCPRPAHTPSSSGGYLGRAGPGRALYSAAKRRQAGA